MKIKKRILIFAVAGAIALAPVALAKNNNADRKIVYIVQNGDTVYSIANKYKDQYEKVENKVAKIQIDNNVTEVIYPGQKLIVTKED